MRKLFTSLIALALVITSVAISSAHFGSNASAACTPLGTAYGQTTNSVNVTDAGSYHVYLRVKTSDSSVNTLNMQIDQTSCNLAMGGTALTANTWTWVDYQGGNITNKLNVSLSAGNHSFVIAGTGVGMQVDRIILSKDSGCVPTGTGDNCTIVAPTPPVAVPVVTLNTSTTSVTVGDTAKLTWTSTNDPSSCTATGDWTGTKTGTGTFTTPALSVAKNYTFSLTCTNEGGASATKTVTVTANPIPVPVVTLTVTPGSTTTGKTVALTWSATNSPTSCTATGDWTGTKDDSGTFTTPALTTAKTYSYGLSCTNAGGASTTKTVAVVVTAAVAVPVVSLSVSPTELTAGSTATLTWSATNNPTSCTATNDWTGAKDDSGTFTTPALSDIRTYSFSLTCANSGGTSTTKTVTVAIKAVQVPVVTLSVTPTVSTVGGKVTLTWSSTNNATTCTSTGDWNGARTASGTITTGGLTRVDTYVYSLSCSNAGGTSETKTVSVVNNAAPVVPIYLSGDINKDGSVSLLDWSIFKVNFGKSGTNIATARTDINGDGVVNLLDFSLLAKQFGQGSN